MEERLHLYWEELDRVLLDRLVIVNHISNHLAYLNSKALELLNITKETANPPGGVIQKDPVTGEPNGVLEENAIYISVEARTLIMTIAYPDETSRFQALEKRHYSIPALGLQLPMMLYVIQILLYSIVKQQKRVI